MKRPRRGLAETFSRPTREQRVPPSTNPEWYKVARSLKALHSVGRTCPGVCLPGLGPQVSLIMEQYGFKEVRGWNTFSVPQMLDVVATTILRQDRLHRQAAGERWDEIAYQDGYLSAGQWYVRTSREVPMEHVAMDALLEHSPRVTKIYGHVRTLAEAELVRHGA